MIPVPTQTAASGAVRVWLATGHTDMRKGVVAEGFTDDTGSYLLNLNLSLQRSQRVLCVLLARDWPVPSPPAQRALPSTWPSTPAPPSFAELAPISEQDEQLIRSLFLVGGYSSNSQKSSRDESRRIELRIEFFQINEEKTPLQSVRGDVGKCVIGGR